jgi:hypothetical protein
MMPYSKFFPYFYNFSFFGLSGLITLLVLFWSLVWKGWALWEAARNKSKIWFMALLVINTMGILEIIYLFALAANFRDNRKKFKKIFSLR